MAYQKVVLESASNTIAQNTTGSAGTLTTARAIALSGGDVTGTVDFDGSADVSIVANISAGSVEDSMIKDGDITGSSIATDTITASNIGANAVTSSEISGLASGYSSGKVIVAGASEGSFLYGNVLNNAQITIAGGVGMSDTAGAFTTNQSAGETITVNLDIADLTAFTDADASTTLQASDEFAVHDDSDSSDTHKKVTLTQLASKLAGASTSGLNANAGQLNMDLSGLGAISDPQSDDHFIVTDTSASNASKKVTVSRLAELYAGTGLTNSTGTLNVNTSQNIANITGQSSLTVASNTAVSGNLSITGDLTVSGATITTTTETLEIADNKMILNSDLTGNTAVDTGFVVNRADATGDKYAMLFWDESKTGWCIGNHDTDSSFPATSSKLMVNVENAGAPSGTETTVGGMVYDTSNNEMYIRTS